MNFSKITFILLLITYTITAIAQAPIGIEHTGACGHTQQALEEYYKKNPEVKKQAEEAKVAFVARLKERAASGEATLKSAMTKRIPVVVHVIYGECGDGNIDRSRIDDAILQLNNDFQGLNAQDPNLPYANRVGNMDIEFFLAEKDPNGNPTNGITRTESNLTYAGVGFGPELRALIMWPGDTYLNVYVVKQINGGGSSGVAIYPEDAENLPTWDGIAMADWAMGPTGDRRNYNTIISHEVGHWLGLRHIWGDGNGQGLLANCSIDDFSHLDNSEAQYVTNVDNPPANFPNSIYNDTPNTLGNNTVTGSGNTVCNGPETPTNTCQGNEQDMLENIMDYTGCSVMFSKGQVNYMNAVLEDNIAQRNQIPLNAQSVTLGNQSRVVFQGATLKESEANNGTINYTLDIELVSANFNASFPGGNLTEGSHYNVTFPTGFAANNLQVNVQRSAAAANKATLQLTGSTTTHADDIDFTIVFQNSAFNTNIAAANRTKILKVDFLAPGISTHMNQSYEAYVGPEGQPFDEIYFKPNLQVGIGYTEQLGYFVYTLNSSVQVATQSAAAAQVFNNSSTLSPSNTFATAIQPPYLALDISTISNGGEFYIGFRNGCSSHFNYGWVRAQKDASCDRIKILDAFIHGTPNQSITVGNIESPKAVYNTLTIKESSPGTFSSAEIELKGIPSNRGFKSAISSADFNIAAAGNNSLPADFTASNLSINVSNSRQATISLTTPTNMSQDFSFQLTFNSSAFINGTPSIDMGNSPLTVDYITITTVSYNAYNVVTSANLDFIARNIGYSNNSYHSIGVQAINQGYLFFVNQSSYPFVPNIACKTPNSQEVRLFNCGDATNNLNFNRMGGGLANASQSIDGQTYVSNNDLLNWTDDFAYVMLEYDLGCGQTITAWAKLDISDYTNSVTLVETTLSEAPSVIPPCEKSPCDPILLSDEDARRLYVENVVVGNVTHSSTHSTNAYQDHTNVVLPLQAGNNSVSFTQGNGVSSTGAQYSPQNAFWYAFIDFNQNDHFEPEEQVLAHEGQDFQGNLNINPNTPSGNYKMRIAMSVYDLTIYNANFVCSPSVFQYGEMEDYTVSIGGGGCNVGEACNDNNVCTVNDVLNSNCNCVGTFQDSDNDGICDENDECPNDPNNTCNTQSYCQSAGSMTNYEFIENVNVAGINNTSGNNGGYADYTAQTANVDAGTSYAIILTPGFLQGAYTENWKVWIDFNKDGDFTDSGEEILSQSSNTTINSSISIPASAPSGSTRMRVTMNYSNPVTSCGGFQYGEVEDYTVNIGGAACNVGSPCNDNDDCTINDFYDSNCNCSGTFQDADDDNICDFNDECPNDPNNNCNTCTVGASCNDNNACTENDVYDINCNCSGTFQDADNDGICAANDCNDNNANVPTTPGTTCNDNNPNTTDDVIQADGCTCSGTTPTGSEYCEPTGQHPQIFISNVSLEQIDNPTGNDGYGDYTNQVANLSQGQSYILSVTETTPWSFYWRGWIDYDQSGTFDANELVLSANNASGTFQQNIIVPANAPTGTTRMRISLKYANGSAPQACDNISLGEVEDYSINIQQGAAPCNAAVPTASQITNTGSVYCQFAYGYCQGHTGFNKEFELTNLSTGSTNTYASNTHYAAFPGLSQGTNYQYRVRIECANTGTYGGWSPYQNFTTPSCKLETELLNLNNFPNPFSNRTTIEFSLPNDSSVTLHVYDLTGRRVATLLDDELKIAGNHRAIFDGKAHPSGMYMYTIQAGEYTGTGKMNIIK